MKTLRCDLALLQRFQAERQSLATMDHPSIAKVFDAGATPDGEPYFVMEYVPGRAITDYCDQKHLNIRQRLELFLRVCEGVQHAHQKAIIHRDLKPANILVVEVDARPAPRIIDFGLAKTVSPLAADETMLTRAGDFVGTPGYMSPEQADPTITDVDTRTDVYSLGTVLYVLLAGSLPFETKPRRKQEFHEILRQLREDDPPTPSTKVIEDRESMASKAELRGTEPKQLVHLLRGDLDWIALKALERDRNRRYGTPSELAADIQRYLRHEPVIARQTSTSYRLQKYLRRHRVGVAATAALVVLLAVFAVTFLLAQAAQIRRITRERDRADRITTFMVEMFNVSDPSAARGNSITAREILENASKQIDAGLAKDPELQAGMMHVMGEVYNKLGLYPRGQSLFTRAAKIRRRILGPNNRDTLTSTSLLAQTLWAEGHFPEAEKLERETLDVRSRVLGPQHLDTLKSRNSLARVLWTEGKYPEALKLYREALETELRTLGGENRETLQSMTGLAKVLNDTGQYAEAERLQREVLEIRRRLLGPEHPDTLSSMTDLAGTLDIEGHYAEAEKLNREVLETKRRILGPEHPDTLASMSSLAAVLYDETNYTEAENWNRKVLEIKRRILGPEHPETVSSINNLAAVLYQQRNYDETEKLFREVLAIRRRVLGPEHPDTLASTSNLGSVLMAKGHYEEADGLFRETLKIQRRVLGPEHPDLAVNIFNLGVIALHKGKREEALSLMQEAVDAGLEPGQDLSIEKDPDLKLLHGDPRFAALVAHAKERAAAAQKAH
jgi:non-specific serine/threonine protein kinase/serine/threonine-protein kinase